MLLMLLMFLTPLLAELLAELPKLLAENDLIVPERP
jgi:hypothetical protein